MAGVRGARESHQVGGTGPQGCEPDADGGAAAAKVLKILIFVRYTGKNQPCSAAPAFPSLCPGPVQ